MLVALPMASLPRRLYRSPRDARDRRSRRGSRWRTIRRRWRRRPAAGRRGPRPCERRTVSLSPRVVPQDVVSAQLERYVVTKVIETLGAHEAATRTGHDDPETVARTTRQQRPPHRVRVAL